MRHRSSRNAPSSKSNHARAAPGQSGRPGGPAVIVHSPTKPASSDWSIIRLLPRRSVRQIVREPGSPGAAPPSGPAGRLLRRGIRRRHAASAGDDRHPDRADGRHRRGRTNAGTWVRYDGAGRPPVTDGPFAETKDLIAGWMVIDVDG